MPSSLIRKEEETQRQSCRDSSAVPVSQGTPKIFDQTPEARKRQVKNLTYRFQRQHGLANTMILNF